MNWIAELRRLLKRAMRAPPGGPPPGPVSCNEAAAALFDWLDGELSPDLESRIGTHLETCAHCYPKLVFERSFLAAVSSASRGSEIPAGLRDGVMHALKSEGLSIS